MCEKNHPLIDYTIKSYLGMGELPVYENESKPWDKKRPSQTPQVPGAKITMAL